MSNEITEELLKAELADLALDLTEEWRKQEEGFDSINFCTLNTPAELDVVKRNGTGFTEKFLGGEDFVPRTARVKGDALLIIFKPRDTSNFSFMTMLAEEASNLLDGFDLLAVTPQGAYDMRMGRIFQMRSQMHEAERMRQRFLEKNADYIELGFGSF